MSTRWPNGIPYNDLPMSGVSPHNADARERVALITTHDGVVFDLNVCDEHGGFLDLAGCSYGAALARAAAWAGAGARIRIGRDA